VRQKVGDTDTTFQLISDEEIELRLYERNNSVHQAAIDICRDIAASLAKKAAFSQPGVSVQAQQRHKHYLELAKELDGDRKRRAADSATLYVGGDQRDDNQTLDEDSDRTQPKFKIGDFGYRSQYTDEEDPLR
jgi:hypothetical protein